jgi:iron complex outermembrane receptor protein
MMKSFNVLLLIVLAIPAMARQTASLTGTVLNPDAGPVPGATVYVLNTGRAAITNSDGLFTITGLQPGKYTVRITAVGYADLSRELSTGEKDLRFTLVQSVRQLDAVMVSAQKKDEWLQQVPFSVSALSSTQVTSYRLWNAKQLTAIVPNLYSADPGDGRNVTSIRGILCRWGEPV